MKACIFVDGENFRHSLNQLFCNDNSSQYSFKSEHYLPTTNWFQFFDHIALHYNCEFLRAYWYVIDEVIYWPYNLPETNEDMVSLFMKNTHLRKILSNVSDKENKALEIKQQLEQKRDSIQRRVDGWKQVQSAMELKTNNFDFIRFGYISYNLANKKFAKEKGVDTKLTSDLIRLSKIYDVAIIISGDGDYIPPTKVIKDWGKRVYCVSFLNKEGKELPGGAWRLIREVDKYYQIPFNTMKNLMGIEFIGS